MTLCQTSPLSLPSLSPCLIFFASEYMLWTDNSSREFIAEFYPWFLDAFNDYTYPIQRADAIRYFVLHHYGGVYFDLDIGCHRALDPLLVYPVILPKTIPVGISNDLIFAEKGHPFLAQVIHGLTTFDHSWVLNYPTVMFSTGPMFLSAQYSIFTASHAAVQSDPIRILPKSLYGKNAKEGEAPNSFFSHFYGSSWHADDAGFIAFLNHWGKILMWIGLVVLIIGAISFVYPGKQRGRYGLGRAGGYEVLLPRRSGGHWHFGSSSSDGSASPTEQTMPVILPVDVPSSPTSSESSNDQFGRSSSSSTIMGAFQRVRNRVAVMTGFREDRDDSGRRAPTRNRRQRYSRGVLFFLPAIFTPSQDVELGSAPPSYSPHVPLLSRPQSRASQTRPDQKLRAEDYYNSSGASEQGSEGSSNSRSAEHGTLIEFGGDTPASHHSRSRSSSHHRDA